MQRGARRPAETTANKSSDCGVQALVRCKPAAALFTSGLDLSFTSLQDGETLDLGRGYAFPPSQVSGKEDRDDSESRFGVTKVLKGHDG